MFVTRKNRWYIGSHRRNQIVIEDIDTYNRAQKSDQTDDHEIYGIDTESRKVAKSVSIASHGSDTVDLPKGIYHLSYDWTGQPIFTPETFEDRGDFIEGLEAEAKLRTAIGKFLTAKTSYDTLKIPHRRGLLLYGPPGNGKTRTIIEVAKTIQPYHVFVTDYTPTTEVREVFRSRPVMIVIEEVTELVYSDAGIANFLNFMDGVNSMNNALVVCTTNYPQLLPPNVIDRPSRFDELIHCGHPTLEDRHRILKKLTGAKLGEDLEEILNETEGYSIAYLKELVLYSKIQDCSLLDSLNVQKARRAIIRDEFRSHLDKTAVTPAPA